MVDLLTHLTRSNKITNKGLPKKYRPTFHEGEIPYREIVKYAKDAVGIPQLEMWSYYSKVAMINDAIRNKIVEEDFVFDMPYRMGQIYIDALPPDYENPKLNYKKTRQYRKKRYFLNEHSDGWRFRLIWRKGKFANNTLYHLIFTERFKRSIYFQAMKGMMYKPKKDINYVSDSLLDRK